MPSDVCKFYDGSVVTPPVITDPSPDPDSVALIIGGYDLDGLTNSVEIFGCPGREEASLRITDFPEPLYLSSGAFVDSEGNYSFLIRGSLNSSAIFMLGMAMVCGGYVCPEEDPCSLSDRCLFYKPDTDEWREAPSLAKPRFNFNLFPRITNVNESLHVEQMPAVMGYHVDTEVLDPFTKEWTTYLDMPYEGVSAMYCFTEYEGFIYVIRNVVLKLDPINWTMVEIAQVPAALQSKYNNTVFE